MSLTETSVSCVLCFFGRIFSSTSPSKYNRSRRDRRRSLCVCVREVKGSVDGTVSRPTEQHAATSNEYSVFLLLLHQASHVSTVHCACVCISSTLAAGRLSPHVNLSSGPFLSSAQLSALVQVALNPPCGCCRGVNLCFILTGRIGFVNQAGQGSQDYLSALLCWP